jgi:hypothetical protein
MTVEDINGKRFQNAAINAVKQDLMKYIPLMVICFSSSLTERLIIERMNTVEV